MTQVTRRSLITRAAAGAATVGVMAAVPGLIKADASSPDHAHAGAPIQESDTVVAHVRNRTTGEVALYVGAREVIIHDHELVRRLLRAAR